MHLIAILFEGSDLVLELVLQIAKLVAILTNLFQYGVLERLVARDLIPLCLSQVLGLQLQALTFCRAVQALVGGTGSRV